MENSTSIVITTKNDESTLPILLEAVGKQKKLVDKVVVVDYGSLDSTIEIAKQFKAEIIRIPAGDYSRSYGLNVGIEKTDSAFVSFFSGCCVPAFDNFLSAGVRYLGQKKVVGVFGPLLSMSQSSPAERVWYSFNLIHLYLSPKVIGKLGEELMNPHSAVFKRELWQEHKFDLDIIDGTENLEWSSYFLLKGFKFIFEPKMAVGISRDLTFSDLMERKRKKRERIRKIKNSQAEES